jgi:hypothetical protein
MLQCLALVVYMLKTFQYNCHFDRAEDHGAEGQPCKEHHREDQQLLLVMPGEVGASWGRF